jgi:hypothetical protein
MALEHWKSWMVKMPSKLDNIADVITSLQVIRSAVDAGELDKRIEAVTGKIKEGMREATPTPVQTPAAPEKRSIFGTIKSQVLSNKKRHPRVPISFYWLIVRSAQFWQCMSGCVSG